MEDKKEAVMQGRSFKHPVPFSNFVMPDGRMLVFNPAHGQNYGEIVTTEPVEIAELERACKTSGLIYETKEEIKVPVKAEQALTPQEQARRIAAAAGNIDKRKEAAQNAMQAMSGAEAQKASGNSGTGVVTSANVSGAATNSNSAK